MVNVVEDIAITRDHPAHLAVVKPPLTRDPTTHQI
jgi:hypothetical protein